MVIFHFLWVFMSMMLISGTLSADVKVTAEAEGPSIYENTPIEILITVSHASSESIDISSFKAGGKSIKASLTDEQVMTATGDLKLSMFHFEMPALAKGLHLIPEIQVSVGGKPYQSVPATFEVLEGKGAANKSSGTQKKPVTKAEKAQEVLQEAFLKFESFVDGPKVLYPNQKTLVGYRYTYNTSIETTGEEAPLLAAKGLIKVGDKIVQEDEKNGVSTLQLIQIVKGDKPGEFTYGPSVLEGIPYQLHDDGSRIYAEKIIAPAETVTIKVIPFPEIDKPSSFNGALGNFKWKINLLSSPKVNGGDELSLSVEATGQGDWDTVNLPELCCQPGMSGQFRLSDLPNVGKLEGQTKKFDVILRPLSNSITEIPSIEFSSLDPDTGKYQVQHSTPIPITVEASSHSEPDVNTAPSSPPEKPKEEWRDQIKIVPPLEISGNIPLKNSDLHNHYFGEWWVLLLIPFGVGLLIFQYNWINFISKQKAEQSIDEAKSITLLNQAYKAPAGSAQQDALLRQALLLRLVEVGQLDSDNIDDNGLAQTGLQGEVRTFLHDLDERRYAGKLANADDEILQKAKSLYEKLESGSA